MITCVSFERHLCLSAIYYVNLIYETTVLLCKLLTCVSFRRHLWLRDKCDKFICIDWWSVCIKMLYHVLVKSACYWCYDMFLRTLHPPHAKVYTWDKSMFSMFLANTIEISAFNRLYRSVYEMQKFWKETFSKEKFQKSWFPRQASKGKFWENEKNILVFTCSYHPLHKEGILAINQVIAAFSN